MNYKVEYNKRGFVVLGAFIAVGIALFFIDLGSTGLKILGLLIVFMGLLSLLIISSTINSLYVAARILQNQAQEEEEKNKKEGKGSYEAEDKKIEI